MISYFNNIQKLGIILMKFIPKNVVGLIVTGHLRGYKWVVKSGSIENIIGNYEQKKVELFVTQIHEGNVVLNVGANIGYFSLLFSHLVGPTGFVYSFEPLPRNVDYMRTNLILNNIRNVTIVESAVAFKEGNESFAFGDDHSQGHISSQGDLIVNVVSLDKMIERFEIPVPQFIKMDIEGGEYEALLGARALFNNHNIVLFLATHGPDVHKKCIDLLKYMGYTIKPLDQLGIDFQNEILAYKEKR
jgi:FkbM family methyltransferase